LCLGAPAEVTARCLQVVIGGGALWAVWWLGTRADLPGSTCGWVTLCLVPAVAMYALTDTTPDLLVAALLTVYVGIVIGTDYPRSLGQAAACGLVGALAYLAKAYAFPFFVVHFLAVSAYLGVRRRGSGAEVRRLAGATALGVLVFAVVAGCWAGLLSSKYARITIGTTGSYQLSLFSGGGGLFGGGGLLPPTNATAISAWEDPTDLRTSPRPAASPKTRPVAATPASAGASSWGWNRSRELATRIGRNLVGLGWTLVRFAWTAPLILIGLLLSCRPARLGPAGDRCVILLGTILIYSSGYLLLFIHERYFWLLAFLLAVAAGIVATTVPTLARGRWGFVCAAATGISFTLWPIGILARVGPHVLEATPAVAKQLAVEIEPGSRIASDSEWGITNSIAYHLDARYYGVLPSRANVSEQERQLRQHRIAYLVVWGDPGRFPVLASAREVPLDVAGDRRFDRVPRVYAVPAPDDPSGVSGGGKKESK